jgi:hypothetical protein
MGALLAEIREMQLADEDRTCQKPATTEESVFAWGGKACEKAQIAPKTPCAGENQGRTGKKTKKILAIRRNRTKIAKTAPADRGLETIWEIPVKIMSSANGAKVWARPR